MNPRYKFTCEHPIGESITEPNQSYTIREIFQRMKAGLPIHSSRCNYQFGEDDDDSFFVSAANRPDSDITDIMEEAAELEQTLRTKQKRSKTSSAPNADAEVRPADKSAGETE